MKPKSYTECMRGLHKKVWADIEADKYIEGEREVEQTCPKDQSRKREAARIGAEALAPEE